MLEQGQDTSGANYPQQIAFAIVPFLMLLYAAPVVAASVASLFGYLNGGNAFGIWFVSLVSNPDSALNLFHKVIIPITSGVTVATMWRGRHASWTIFMTLALVAAVCLAIYLLVVLGVPDVQKNLWQPANDPRVTSDAQLYTLASSYVGRVEETLTTYLLILLGLQVIPRG